MGPAEPVTIDNTMVTGFAVFSAPHSNPHPRRVFRCIDFRGHSEVLGHG